MNRRSLPRPLSVRLPLWHELRAVDKEVRQTIQGKYGIASLGTMGLNLIELGGWAGYEGITPLNVCVFADTGVDGAHFSLLVEDNAVTETSPIVMTTPSCGRSFIVGESLRDFLCLGLRCGYDVLDLLDSDTKDEAMRAFLGPADAAVSNDFKIGDVDRRILDLLQQRLRLEPWTDRLRYDALQELHAGRLKLPPNRFDRP